MCTQITIIYRCGCPQKGEFKQCDPKYDGESNLQCAQTNVEEERPQCYCPKHLPKDSKALTEYGGRNPQHPG